jgi:ABC-2 type transport system permease protein
MILRIARRELLDMTRDGRFRTAVAVIGVLVVASLLAGWAHTRRVRAEHASAAAVQRDLWLGKGEMNPHSAAHYGAFAFKPISEVAAIDPGLEPYVGVSVFLEAHRQNLDKFRPVEDATPLKRLGDLTAASTLQLLVPLFIVALTFSAFAGEREQGTLRQLLASGVRGRTLMAGKLLGLAAPIAIVGGAAAVGGVAALALLGGDGGLQSLPRASLLIAVYLAYFAVWLALGLAVSALAPSSRVALVVLLAAWFVNGFLAPRSAATLARTLHPTPSGQELQQAIDADLEQLTPWDELVRTTREALLAEHRVARPEDLPINPEGVALIRGEEADTAVYERHHRRLVASYGRQASIFQWAGAAAPLLAVQTASMALAGTDYAHHHDFLTAAERYRTSYVKTLNDTVTAQRNLAETWKFQRGEDLWDDVPPFEYVQPSVSWAVRGVQVALMILAAWTVAALGAAAWSTARLRVI